MMAGGLRSGAEVIISSHTMVATASAIYYAGGKPVPVDIGADHLVDPAAVRAAIASRRRQSVQLSSTAGLAIWMP